MNLQDVGGIFGGTGTGLSNADSSGSRRAIRFRKPVSTPTPTPTPTPVPVTFDVAEDNGFVLVVVPHGSFDLLEGCTFQWYLGEETLGVTTQHFEFTKASSPSGTYTVEVTYNGEVIEQASYDYEAPLPTVTVEVNDQAAYTNLTATCSYGASMEWRLDGVLVRSGSVPTDVLTLSKTDPVSAEGSYTAVVTNVAGSVESDPIVWSLPV
jgi:hypothetical protein